MARKPRHGMSRSRLYQCWADMKSRCNNPKNTFFYRYGGRGIAYCEEWEKFESFMEWALSSGYSDNLTLERIDNDGDYCPQNCCWATQTEQAYNKKHTPNKTGFKGIHPSKRCAGGEIIGYKATAIIDHKEKYIGFAKTPEEAAKIRTKYLLENGYDFAL